MANTHRCRAHLNVHVTLEPPAGERVIQLREGDEVDLDQVVRPARPGREAMTLGEAIGDVDRFFELHGQPLDLTDEERAALPRLDLEAPDDPATYITMTADPGATLPAKE